MIRLTETISVHFFGISETRKENGPSKNTGNSKSQMDTKRATKALLEVIPPRICVTFRRGSFWFRPKTSKMRIWKPRPENTTNTVSGSRPDFSEKSENHETRSELDPYSTSRAENQAFWISEVLPIQWDPSGTPKLPYKIQNQPKIQWIQ